MQLTKEDVEQHFAESMREVLKTKDFLQALIDDPNYVNIYNKRVLDMLISACDYLDANLDILLKRMV